MGVSGWKRGLIGGAIAAFVMLLMPDGALEPLAASAGLDVTILRSLLALLGFAVGYVVGTKLMRRADYEFDGADDAPLPVAQQMVASPAAVASPAPAAAVGTTGLEERLAHMEKLLATLPAQTTKAIRACPSADLDRTLRSIQRALRKPHSDPVLVEAVQTLQSDVPAALVSRIEALEARLSERLAAIEGRLAIININDDVAPLPPLTRLTARRPAGLAPRRISEALAEIRQSMDGLPH